MKDFQALIPLAEYAIVLGRQKKMKDRITDPVEKRNCSERLDFVARKVDKVFIVLSPTINLVLVFSYVIFFCTVG